MNADSFSPGAPAGNPAAEPRGVRFGPFLFDPESGELWRDGAAVKLQPQPAKLLALLIERRGRTVRREEIQQHLWGDQEVDAEAGVNFAIRRVRAALGEDAGDQLYVETLARRGYRFKAKVEPVGDPSDGTPRGLAPRHALVALAALITVLVVVWLGRGLPAPVAVSPEEPAALGEAPAELPESPARDPYLRGLYLLRDGEPDALPRAASLFRQALAADPGFAPAYVGLEEASRAELGEDERAELLEKALEHDPALAKAHSALGWLELENRQRPEAARDDFEAALAIDDRLATAVHGSALAHAALGEVGVALERIERGLELDPAGAVVRGDAFLIYFWTGRPEQAVAQLERALELEPAYGDLRWEAAFYLAQSGRWHPCVEQLRTLLQEDEPEPADDGEKSSAAWREEAEELYRRATGALHGPTGPLAGPLAQTYLVLGEPDEALRWLEASEEQDWYGLTYLAIDPSWDPIRQEPRFRALLDRLGLSEPSRSTSPR